MTPPSDTEETLALIAQSAAEFAKPDGPRARHVRDTMGGFDPAVWCAMADQGWLASLLPEERGGTGLGLAAAASIAGRLGYACHSEPFVPVAVVAVTCLLACPNTATNKGLLEAIAAGHQVVTLAWQPPSGDLELDALEVLAEATADGVVLRGAARFVPHPDADGFIVAARLIDEVVLCHVPSPSKAMRLTREPMADGTSSGRLEFEVMPVPAAAVLARGPMAREALVAAIDAGIVASAAELSGLIERSLELTLEYLGVRQQFGQPIGSFQALQHRAVDMWIQKELTRAALRAALAVFGDPRASPRERSSAASSAKARASQAALYVAGQAVQLHGAIGTTDEYELGAYVNRCLTLAAWFGSGLTHRRRYGRQAQVHEQMIDEALVTGSTLATELGVDDDFSAMSDDDFRKNIRADFEANYPSHLRYLSHRVRWTEVEAWYLRMSKKGWIAPAWPREAGGMGLTHAKLLIFLEEQERWGIARYQDHGVLMVGPLLLRFGTQAQRERFLAPILRCEHIWCQGYSEPGAGSDLASLRTRAESVDGPDGPAFVVNGQKTWTTLAQDATHIFVLARTDAKAKKQEGISFLLVDIASPGIRVRPIRDIAGHEEFCEVFFDDVRVPARNLVGQLNEGWTVAKSLLGFERVSLGSPKFCEYGLQVLTRVASLVGVQKDQAFQDKFAGLRLDVAHLGDAYAGFADMLVRGMPLGQDVSLLKIWSTETFQRIADLAIETAGSCGGLAGKVAIGKVSSNVLGLWHKARTATIYGGSSEIQRNIIARQVLRLPVAGN